MFPPLSIFFLYLILGNESKNIAIIGQGVIGLSTATALIDLQESKLYGGDLSISIFHDLDLDDTLSVSIAGLHRIDDGTQLNRIYGSLTFNRLAMLFRTVGGSSGVQMVSGHIASDNKTKLDIQEKNYADIVYNFRFLSEREIKTQLALPQLPGTGAWNVIHYTAYTSEGARYCPYLKQELINKGVKFVKKRIQSLDALAINANFDVVINAAGIRGSELAGDDKDPTYPIRGVLLKVEAPWQKHFLYRDFGVFTIPVIEGVYIGTKKEVNVSEPLSTNKDEINKIFDTYAEIQPAIRGVPITKTFVGSRPGRQAPPPPIHSTEALTGFVRVAMRNKKDGKAYKIVHNYGHGGNGFTLAYGTGMHAAKLALGMDTSKFSKAWVADGRGASDSTDKADHV